MMTCPDIGQRASLARHAGAIIQAFSKSASEKVELLRDAGVAISPSLSENGRTMETLLKRAA
jgi:malate-CoA ligase subunit alpha